MMRKLLLSLLTFLLWSAAAQAQTTWNPSDSAPGLVLSGGNLTVATSAANTHAKSRATVAKYNGKWCYQFTVNNTPSSQFSIGFANKDLFLTHQGLSLGWTDFAQPNGWAEDGVGLGNDLQVVVWNNLASSGAADPPIAGTGEACVDLDADAPLIWITPNIAGTGGPGGGPKWNGTTTDTPGIGAGEVGGFHNYLGPIEYFPTFDGFNNDSVTAKFTGFTPPTGFNTWDTAGGTPSVPGPYSGMTINLADAPAYTNNAALTAGIPTFTAVTSASSSSGSSVLTFTSTPANAKVGASIWDSTANNAIGQGTKITAVTATTVTISTPLLTNVASGDTIYFWKPASRIVAGPAWDGSTYTDNQPLYLWQVVSGGTTSASGHGVNLQSCTSPANTGGIYATSFPGATTATDGTVTLVCLSKVDDLTFGSIRGDTTNTWAASTALNYDYFIKNGKNVYSLCAPTSHCVMSGTNPVCTTGTSGPPTGAGPVTDGTCTWYFVANVPYSSGTIWPHLYGAPGQFWENIYQDYNFDVHINMWYGGYENQFYYSGAANETPYLMIADHNNAIIDQNVGCYHSIIPGQTNPPAVIGASTGPGCRGFNTPGFQPSMNPPFGDSFQDDVSVAQLPLRYDPSRGLAIYTDMTFHINDGGYTVDGSFNPSADVFNVERIQVLSQHGPAIYLGVNGSVDTSNNILEGGDATQAVIDTCCGVYIHDNLIISHSTQTKCAAVAVKYLVAMYNNTIVGPGNAQCTFYMNSQSAGISTVTSAFSIAIQNNAIFGFPIIYAWGNYGGNPYNGVTTNIKNNATDAPPCCEAPFVAETYNAIDTFHPQDLGVGNNCGIGNSGSCYSLSVSNALVNPTFGSTFDARIKAGASIIGAGANFSSNYGVFFTPPVFDVPQSTDIVNNARPTSGRFDAGVTQFQGAAPIPQRGPGRFMRGDNDNYLPFHEAAN